MIIKYLLFWFLLSPVGQCDTDHGCKYVTFENALKASTEEILAAYNKNPHLLYKLGDIGSKTTEEITALLRGIIKNNADNGALKIGTNVVAGEKNATLFSNIKNNPDLSNLKSEFNNNFNISDKSKFLDDFKDVTLAEIKSFEDVELVRVWKKWRDKGIVEIEILKIFKRVWSKFIRGVSFDDFYTKTFDQISRANSKKFAPELYEAWRLKDVSQMQGIYRKYGLNPTVDYPPCEGFWGIDKVGKPSNIEWFDRFQTRETLGGGYAGYIADPNEIFTISSRALKENYSEIITQGQSYYYFKFKLKNIPDDLIFEYGEAMPWFDEIGGAIQIKSSTGFHLLRNNIDILEKWSLINGQWTRIL